MFLVYIEVREGKVKKSSLEVLSEGKRRSEELKKELAAVLVGSQIEGHAKELLNLGAAKVFVQENTLLSHYSPQGYLQALLPVIQEIKPEVILLPASSLGKDLAPRLAVCLGVSLASDCTRIAVKNGELEFTRPIYAGKAFLTFRLKSSPQLATLRPNVFPTLEPAQVKGTGTGEVIKKEVPIAEEGIKARSVEVMKEEGADLDVTEADVVISGGRGMKGPENFAMLRELASLIPNAAIGASRSAVDSGWIDHQHQVGQTGKTVSPNLYLAVGLSGAIQHLAGMSSSKYIAAINKDPEAPIFKVADFGVVGDLFQVVPVLKQELKKVLSE